MIIKRSVDIFHHLKGKGESGKYEENKVDNEKNKKNKF